MTKNPETPADHAADGEKRFDMEAAHRILRRAAEEQARREGEDADSFTLRQLEEIASEAGISPEAVHAAVTEHEDSSQQTELLVPASGQDAPAGWLTTLERRLPASWSPRLRRALLLAAGVAVLGLLAILVGVTPVLFVLALAVVLLIVFFLLLGFSPV
jgi:hypothetical protein